VNIYFLFLQEAPVFHFGLGEHDMANIIEIFWLTGEHQVIEQRFKAGRSYQLERVSEGSVLL